LNSPRAATRLPDRDAAPSAPGALAMLRTATWPSHQRLEKRLDVKSRFTTPSAYRAHLLDLHAFSAALESRIGPDRFGAALPDYPMRLKQPLLAADLATLGVDRSEIESHASPDDLPDIPSCAAAFGAAYVFEGATLGGRTLLPLVTTHLGLGPTHGARFLGSYGDAVDRMWADFRAALETWCVIDARRAEAREAAIATFGALERWLCREAQ
jgi:heme oxygenase